MIAKRSKEPGTLNRVDTAAFAAIVLCSTVVEVTLNDAVERILGARAISNRQWRLVYEHLMEDRWTARDQATLLFDDLMEKDIDWSSEPWESMEDLRVLRNELVHYQSRPVESTFENRYFPERSGKRLTERARKLGVLSLLKDEGRSWIDIVVNRTFATWAYKTAKNVVDTVDSLTSGDTSA